MGGEPALQLASSATTRNKPPWHTDLYQILRDNIATLYQASEDGFGTPLPKFVRAELDGYLRCQVLGRGFAHMVCNDCGKTHLLAFCCRGRGFCPCCTGRRMAQTAANLTEFVLPDVPLRQFVLTVPHPLRPLIAYDRELLPRIHRIFCQSIQRFYRARLAQAGHASASTGSVTAIQRASSDLRLNPHLHGVFLDGVFVAQQDKTLRWHCLPAITDLDVAELLQHIVARVLRHLHSRGLLQSEPDAPDPCLQSQGSEQPVLDALATAATYGQSLAGPELRPGRTPQPLQSSVAPLIQTPLCSAHRGFSLHANTTVAANDKPGAERLIKYILRPPLCMDRIERLDAGRVRLRLKRVFSDGTWAVEMDELSLVARLAAMVPPPWQNQVRYSGVLAPASSFRKRVIPAPPQASTAASSHPEPQPSVATPGPPDQPLRPRGTGCRYWPWHLLMARSFGSLAPTCPDCGGTLKLRALVQDAHSIRRFLEHMGLPTDVPTAAPPRGPPYYRGPVRRLRRGHPQATLSP